MHRLAFVSLLAASLLLTGCGSDDGAPGTTTGPGTGDDVPTGLPLAPTATVQGTIPAGLTGSVAITVDGQPATITGSTWTATIPVPADQALVELRVDGMVVDSRRMIVKR